MYFLNDRKFFGFSGKKKKKKESKCSQTMKGLSVRRGDGWMRRKRVPRTVNIAQSVGVASTGGCQAWNRPARETFLLRRTSPKQKFHARCPAQGQRNILKMDHLRTVKMHR
mmetsp:Transcript_55608/g.146721  ORF Transcript_55608/g.146721 Transcript_55608/m.146721 type:complete len:111 (+) Transcript_55608:166-498(+)